MGFFEHLNNTDQDTRIGALAVTKNSSKKDIAQQTPVRASKRKAYKKPERLSFLKPCPLCKGREFILSVAGGFFCEVCQPGIKGQPVEATGPDRLDPVAESDHEPSVKQGTTRPEMENFATAWPWIRSHLPELLAVGWTRSALLQRSKFRHPLGGWGLAWLSVWRKNSLSIQIHPSGSIIFNFLSSGRTITQTAYPPPKKNNGIQGT